MSSLRFSRVLRKRLLAAKVPYVHYDNDMMRQYGVFGQSRVVMLPPISQCFLCRLLMVVSNGSVFLRY